MKDQEFWKKIEDAKRNYEETRRLSAEIQRTSKEFEELAFKAFLQECKRIHEEAGVGYVDETALLQMIND